MTDDIERSSARTIQFDSAALREDYAAAGAALITAAEAVPDDAWNNPGLGEWTIRDLVGHAGRSFVTVSDYVAAGVGLDIELGHPFDYGRAGALLVGSDQGAITERGRAAGRALGSDPVTELSRWRDRAVAAVAAHPDDAPCTTVVGVMRLADYLPSRIFELVVHTDDLRRALGSPGTIATAPVGARSVALAFAAGLAAESDRYAAALRALTGRAPMPEGYSVM